MVLLGLTKLHIDTFYSRFIDIHNSHSSIHPFSALVDMPRLTLNLFSQTNPSKLKLISNINLLKKVDKCNGSIIDNVNLTSAKVTMLIVTKVKYYRGVQIS